MMYFISSFFGETALYLIILLSISLIVISRFEIPVPIPYIEKYKAVLTPIAIVLICFSTWSLGIKEENQRYALEQDKQKVYIAELEKKASEKTVEVVTEYVDRVKVVKEKGKTIYEKVPVYITKESDDKCVLPNGFVVMHDSASRNEVPESAGNSNEEPSGIKLSEATEVIVLNYTQYHALVEQLRSLQNWIREMQKTYNVN